MAVPIGSEYVEINGIPLSTPAWRHLDLSDMYSTSGVRGDNAQVARHFGELPRRSWPEAKRIELPLIVEGKKDSDGNEHNSIREGLRKNIEELTRAIEIVLTGNGTFLLVHHLPEGTAREANAQCNGSLQIDTIKPSEGGAQAVVDLLVPEGVLRDQSVNSVSGSSSLGGSFDLTIPNNGNAWQLALELTLSGDATSIEIAGTYSTITADVDLNDGDVVIGTKEFTAVQDPGGSDTDIHGLISNVGHERWLPIPIGGDTVTITPSNGNVDVTVEQYFPWR